MTFTIEGWRDGELIAEECGVEADGLNEMVSTLLEEGFEVFVKNEGIVQ